MERELILSLSKKNKDFIVKESRSSGPGGQNVNRRKTKITITHKASGAQASCQTYRTQEKNKVEAFRRLLETQKFKTWLAIQLAIEGFQRASTAQEGPTGDRGEKIRTYNLVRNEVIDHRIKKVFPDAESILDGNLDKVLEECRLEIIREGK